MKSKFLFPAWCAWLGYFMAVPGFVLGYLNIINKYEIPGFGFKMREKNTIIQSAFENFTNELAIFLVVIGLILIAFSRGRKEDELIARLRLNALYWAVMIYYILYIVAILVTANIGEIPFIGDHISELNIFTPLVIFIARFYYLKYATNTYLMGVTKFLPYNPMKKIGLLISSLSILTLAYGIIFVPRGTWGVAAESVAYISLVIGLLISTFSKNRVEDEFTMQLRFENLHLSVYFNYAILILATFLFYGLSYLVFLAFAQFSLLLFFVIRMEFVNYRNNRSINNVEGELSHEK